MIYDELRLIVSLTCFVLKIIYTNLSDPDKNIHVWINGIFNFSNFFLLHVQIVAIYSTNI